MNDLLGLLDIETRAVANGGQQEANRAGKSVHHTVTSHPFKNFIEILPKLYELAYCADEETKAKSKT